jgi:hypothetical protein
MREIRFAHAALASSLGCRRVPLAGFDVVEPVGDRLFDVCLTDIMAIADKRLLLVFVAGHQRLERDGAHS